MFHLSIDLSSFDSPRNKFVELKDLLMPFLLLFGFLRSLQYQVLPILERHIAANETLKISSRGKINPKKKNIAC